RIQATIGQDGFRVKGGSCAALERIDDPTLRLDDMMVRGLRNARARRLVVEHRGRRLAARAPYALDNGVDRRARVPDLVHDQHSPAVQERVGRELKERRLGPRLTVGAVVRDRGDEDVPYAERVGEDPRGHEAPRVITSMTSNSPRTRSA